jgi:hypothetical protein
MGIYKIWGDGSAIGIFASLSSGYRATVSIVALVRK